MNKEEFIHLAVKCGYAATPQGAEHYTKEHPKEDYDTDDFIAMHESSMHWGGIPSVKGLDSAWGIGKGCGQLHLVTELPITVVHMRIGESEVVI
jgi:hypothetical protein